VLETTRAAFEGRPGWLFGFFANLFARTFTRESLLQTELFARFQVVGVTFYFLDNVFLLNLTLEAAQGVLQRLALLQPDFCQYQSPPLPSNWTQLDYLTVAKKCGKE
jgi:hypothetical protein